MAYIDFYNDNYKNNAEDQCVFEGMTSISALIKAFEQKQDARRILKVLFDVSKERTKARELSFLKHRSAAMGFPVELVDESIIAEYTSGQSHGGIVAICTNKNTISLSSHHIKDKGVYFLIEGIEDPYNFGNAIRTLYTFGADGVIVGERNWMSAAGIVARSSAGCSELLDIYSYDPMLAINLFKDKGYKTVMAGIRDSISISEADLKPPILVVIGGEKRGISRKLLDMADQIIRIDYQREFKGSLSSVASAAVFGYEIMRQIGYLDK